MQLSKTPQCPASACVERDRSCFSNCAFCPSERWSRRKCSVQQQSWQRSTLILTRPIRRRRVRTHPATACTTLHLNGSEPALQAYRLQAAANTPANKAPATAAVPLLLAQSYYALQHPATLNIRYSEAVKACLATLLFWIPVRSNCKLHMPSLQRFAETAVTAYECGYAEETLRQELTHTLQEPSTSDNVKVSSKVKICQV